MKRVFTEFVRALARSPGTEPEPDVFQELWDSLGAALRSELQKRGLWTSPPGFLGVIGSTSWTSPNDKRDGARDAFEELLVDCYEYIFLRRLRSLTAQLKVKDNIDGLVFLNIRHFLLERQQRSDPIGFRVFQMLRCAARLSITSGRLSVTSGDAKIRNETILEFAEPRRRSSTSVSVTAVVSRWSDVLLPEIVTANGKSQRQTIGKLLRLLHGLPNEGIVRFRFKDVVGPLQQGVRDRWVAIMDREGDDTAKSDGDAEFLTVIRLARPGTELEDLESFQSLASRVERSLANYRGTKNEIEFLRRLWSYLLLYAAGSPWKDVSDARVEDSSDVLPSRRQIARVLDIPRNRLPELYRSLGGIVSACRSEDGTDRALMTGRRAVSRSEQRHD